MFNLQVVRFVTIFAPPDSLYDKLFGLAKISPKLSSLILFTVGCSHGYKYVAPTGLNVLIITIQLNYRAFGFVTIFASSGLVV